MDGKPTKEKGNPYIDKYVAASPAARKKILGATVIIAAIVSWGVFLDPAYASFKKIKEVDGRIAKHEERIRRSKIEIPDSNVAARLDLADIERRLNELAKRRESSILAASAGPDLPALIGAAAGSELVTVSTDGSGWPVEHEGRWIHRIEIKVASPNWKDLSSSVKKAEKAAGPTAVARALDIGATADGRIAVRAEWIVFGKDRDWVGHRSSFSEGEL